MDPDPDPAIFVIDLQDANKKLIFYFYFFCYLLFEGTLKVLSSEMDQAESRLIRQDFLKGNVAGGFQKIRPSPIE